MDTNNNLRVGRAARVEPPRRTSSGARIRPKNADVDLFHSLQTDLAALPDCRPGAVARAASLIADPDFPDSSVEQSIAEQMAAHFVTAGGSQPY